MIALILVIAAAFAFVALVIHALRIPDCYKSSMGYNCKHRVYTDGTKECGEWRSEEDREQWSL